MAEELKPLEELFGKLFSPELVFFPVRHHSPACAWHLRTWIEGNRPAAVLVEGPENFSSLIPLLLHPDAKAPFAVYTNYIDKERRLLPPELKQEPRLDFGPPRFAAYYPFCDYSPELVALRAGAAVQARLRFIDLNYPDQVLAEFQRGEQGIIPRVESLMHERFLKRSAYLNHLARKTGCRDQNDLWDHLFEAHKIPTESFARQVAAFCYMARVDATPGELAADGTEAREQHMAAVIHEELMRVKAEKLTGPVLVVTGGFHTCALPDLVRAELVRKPALATSPDTAQRVLIRYSFEQLDALNGYSAGMPSPRYYDLFWQRLGVVQKTPASKRSKSARVQSASEQANASLLQTASELLVEIGRLTREKGMAAALSTADEIAALEQTRRLAQLRGHPGPTREDILDAVRSCFVKGSMDAEGTLLLNIARHVMTGQAIGHVPPDAGVPPIVENFRLLARELRLNISDSVRRKTSLEIYRKTSHRRSSRLFHSLNLLNVSFAVMTGGPNFVLGTGLDRLQEHWEYLWTPLTDGGLVEASIYGATIEEAAANRLLQAIAELEAQGKGRSTVDAVGLLIQACRMGLHRHTSRLLEVIAAIVGEDPLFPSLVAGLNQLVLLWHSREPLEAHHLPQVPELIKVAYQRACYLALDFSQVPADSLDEVLKGMAAMRQIMTTAGELLDPELFWQALESTFEKPASPTLLVGGASGLLFQIGRLKEGDLLALLTGHLGGAGGEPATKVSFLRGVLHTCREVAWLHPELVGTVDALFQNWSEEEFVRVLPELRLAFANLTPKETDQVAGVAANLYGERDLGQLVHHGITEQELNFNVRLTSEVLEILKQDGLEAWAQSP